LSKSFEIYFTRKLKAQRRLSRESRIRIVGQNWRTKAITVGKLIQYNASHPSVRKAHATEMEAE